MKLNNINLIIDKLIYLKKKNNLKSMSVHEPLIDNSEIKFITRILRLGFVSSYGKEITIFENEIKKLTKSKYAIAVNSGTSALHLCLKALNINDNHEILTPSVTFVGTVNPIKYCGATPNFVDINLDNLCVCPIKLEKYLKDYFYIKNKTCFNKKTNKPVPVLIYVNLFGNIGNIEKIIKVTKKYHIKVIEDAAEAFGSTSSNKSAGMFGDIGIFSFNGNKIITTGMGGCIISKNKKLENKIRSLATTAKKKIPFEFIHTDVGYNYRISNINAALGLSQIKKLKKMMNDKKKLHLFYKENFKKININIISNDQNANNWINAILLDRNAKKFINELLNASSKKNIFLRPLWKPIHTMKQFKYCPKDNLRNSMNAYKRVVCLPSSSFIKC